MKKRLRKKFHKGEFQQIGISLMIPANDSNIEILLDTISQIADNNSILFCGGGLDKIILPSEGYENLILPSKIEFLITNLSLNSGLLPHLVIGYFINPRANKISSDQIAKIKSEIDKILGDDGKVNYQISLWN
jgi:hypothetical protein